MLYQSCRAENPNSYFISDINEINIEWFSASDSVGICGATSTPRWLMEKVQNAIVNID
jgi:4-hydroxy-3-methylbut-2-enyl diphosphate reductase